MSKTTGLTLAEAVKSGRPFKRACVDWLQGNAVITVNSALASDWEIQPLPPKQTWTREEVADIRHMLLNLKEIDDADVIIAFNKAGL